MTPCDLDAEVRHCNRFRKAWTVLALCTAGFAVGSTVGAILRDDYSWTVLLLWVLALIALGWRTYYKRRLFRAELRIYAGGLIQRDVQ